MTIAIYPRKSKFSEFSESVANQIALCREYCDRRFDHPTYIVYDEDEGFSGKNTHRPSFQRMMGDLKARKFDLLCCYRLDRISRSVSDFSALLDELQRYGVAFVSLREQFDTSTPIGRAMVYIASVFAQLERETLAERVRDNLYELAKTGRWLGGNTPLGYEAATVPSPHGDRSRKLLTLAPIEDELAQVRDLYQRFLAYGSLSKLLTYCLQAHITSRQGIAYSRTTLRALLTNPVYCTADADAYAYFSDGSYNFCAEQSDFDGVHGIQPFNRTQKLDELTRKKPASEWIIAVGRHAGLLPGRVWIDAQKIFAANRELGQAYKAPRTELALLSGVIRCAKCGSFMRPKAYGQTRPDGTRKYNYICNLKTESRGERCDMRNAPGHDVDELVLATLADMATGRGEFHQRLSSGQLGETARETREQTIRAHESALTEAQRKIDNLVSTLAQGVPEAARKPIFDQMETLEATIVQEQQMIARINAEIVNDRSSQDLAHAMLVMLDGFGDTFTRLSHDEKRRKIRAVVDRVTWDGDNVKIDIFGEKTLPK